MHCICFIADVVLLTIHDILEVDRSIEKINSTQKMVLPMAQKNLIDIRVTRVTELRILESCRKDVYKKIGTRKMFAAISRLLSLSLCTCMVCFVHT